MLNILTMVDKNFCEYDCIFNFLLDGLDYNSVNIDQDLSKLDNIMIIYSSMGFEIENNVKRIIPQLNCDHVLYHLSNEWSYLNYNYLNPVNCKEIKNQIYGDAKLVFKNYWGSFLDTDSIVHLPLFWVRDFPNQKEIIKNKKYKTSFLGQLKSDRQEMMQVMKSMGNEYIHNTSGFLSSDGLSAKEQSKIYSQSVICPCPMGNVHPECFRFCEILESNSIPVIKEYQNFEWHNRIFGYDSPIPKIKSWNDLPHVYNYIIDSGVEQITENIQQWYLNYKSKIKNKFQSKILEIIS